MWKFQHRPSVRECPFVTHVNAPPTSTGRLRMLFRHLDDEIPKAHVAADFRVNRPTVGTWVARYFESGEARLTDHPSTPRRSPQRTRRRSWSRSRPCAGNGSGRLGASTATSSVSGKSCTRAPWDGGWPAWSSLRCPTPLRTATI